MSLSLRQTVTLWQWLKRDTISWRNAARHTSQHLICAFSFRPVLYLKVHCSKTNHKAKFKKDKGIQSKDFKRNISFTGSPWTVIWNHNHDILFINWPFTVFNDFRVVCYIWSYLLCSPKIFDMIHLQGKEKNR